MVGWGSQEPIWKEYEGRGLHILGAHHETDLLTGPLTACGPHFFSQCPGHRRGGARRGRERVLPTGGSSKAPDHAGAPPWVGS